MWFISLFRRAKTKWHGAASWRSFVPGVEILEDRMVPSTFTVLTSADSGDGTLRAVIAAAQSGDQIVFDPSLQGQAITLASQLTISKNLDIEGPGANRLAISAKLRDVNIGNDADDRPESCFGRDL